MASLAGKSLQNTYKDLLQVSNDNAGIDATPRVVSDGEGTSSILYVSTLGISVGTSALDGGNLFQISQSTVGVGTVSTTATGTTVTGSGTSFLRDMRVGQTITVNGETRTVSSVASDTSLTTDAWTGTNTNAAYTVPGGVRFEVFGNGTVHLMGEPTVDTNFANFFYHLRWDRKYTNPDYIAGLEGVIKVSRSTASGRRLRGVDIQNIVSEDNTANWTGVAGIASAPFISTSAAFAGAAGTITGMVGYLSIWNNQAPGTITVTYFTHYSADTTDSVCQNLSGMTIGLQSGGTSSNVHILSGTETFPTGNWGIYEASAYSNYFASSVAIGTDTVPASALLTLASTTKGFLMPRMTTAQRDAISSPAEGLEIFNTTTKKKNFYNGTAWEVVTSS